MPAADPHYRVAHGAYDARALVSSLFTEPGPKPTLVYGISNMDMLERRFPEFSVSFANLARLEAGIPSRFLYTSIKGPIYGRSDHRLLRQSRFLPPERLSGCEDLTIFADTVVFLTEEDTDVMAQAITNPALARQMRGFFNFLWDCAK